MSNNKSTPRKPSKKGKILLGVIVAAAAAYGTLAVLNQETDPTEWKGQRSGYENTK